MEAKTGTKEWADRNVNIQVGCEHGCRYCYAMCNACYRFRMCLPDDWHNPVINRDAVDKDYKLTTNDNRLSTIMFPSSHDITPRNIGECLIVLNKIVIAGYRILIVSKPHWPCITVICDTFNQLKYRAFKENITFRFTIGSCSDDVLGFWEPNAPKFAERLGCLQYAFNAGFHTSVSCEPYLDCFINQLYDTCFPWVSESFWIGKMREMKRRVDFKQINNADYKRFVEPLQTAMSNKFIWALYNCMKDKPLVKWKDSIRKIIAAKDTEK